MIIIFVNGIQLTTNGDICDEYLELVDEIIFPIKGDAFQKLLNINSALNKCFVKYNNFVRELTIKSNDLRKLLVTGDENMIVSETVKVRWNARNKTRYEKLGYNYTKIGDEFIVKIEHLSEGSIGEILVKCDYCRYRYPIRYQTYITIQRKTVSKSDCCEKLACVNKKIMESNKLKYGVKHHIRADNVQIKIKKTLKGKYGVENVFEIEDVKNKIKETNLKKYGAESYTKTKEFKNRVKKTSLEKYGFESHMQHPAYRAMFKGENSPVWKGGVEYHRVERATGEYKNWRKAVFSRDKYRCQCCRVKQGEVNFNVELHAHHIVTWKDSKEHRYDMNNGITFCHDCHNKFHSVYGKKNNDLSQVKEFILNYGTSK